MAIYSRIPKKRIEEEIPECEEQNAFRAGCSCTDGVFNLKELVEKRTAFVELQKSFDTVPRNKLWAT